MIKENLIKSLRKYSAAGTAFLFLGMPMSFSTSRLFVSSTGNTRVQVNQQVSDNNGQCTISISKNSNQRAIQTVQNRFVMEKDMFVQMYTQQRTMWTQMADTWDQQGRNTSQLRNDLNIMEQKINKLSQDYDTLINKWNSVNNNNQSGIVSDSQVQTEMGMVRSDISDLRLFTRQTIHQDIRSIMVQQT